MIADLKQENFSHCKCQACGHFAEQAFFNPRLVPLDQSNIPTIKWEMPDNDPSGIILQAINYNCPICNSPYVEPFFKTELQ